MVSRYTSGIISGILRSSSRLLKSYPTQNRHVVSDKAFLTSPFYVRLFHRIIDVVLLFAPTVCLVTQTILLSSIPFVGRLVALPFSALYQAYLSFSANWKLLSNEALQSSHFPVSSETIDMFTFIEVNWPYFLGFGFTPAALSTLASLHSPIALHLVQKSLQSLFVVIAFNITEKLEYAVITSQQSRSSSQDPPNNLPLTPSSSVISEVNHRGSHEASIVASICRTGNTPHRLRVSFLPFAVSNFIEFLLGKRSLVASPQVRSTDSGMI